MGMIMSYTGGSGDGLASQPFTLISGALYDQFVIKEIKDFDAFHVAILDIFNTFNMALPGKHYDVPTKTEIEDFFKNWNESKEEDKRELFTYFMIKKVNINKVDNSMVITGIIAPPVAMAAKKTGETIPQLRAIKVIPDVIFVPATTILALIAVKVTKRMSFKKVAT